MPEELSAAASHQSGPCRFVSCVPANLTCPYQKYGDHEVRLYEVRFSDEQHRVHCFCAGQRLSASTRIGCPRLILPLMGSGDSQGPPAPGHLVVVNEERINLKSTFVGHYLNLSAAISVLPHYSPHHKTLFRHPRRAGLSSKTRPSLSRCPR